MIRRNAWPAALALLAIAVSAPVARAQLSDNLGALVGENAKRYLGPLPKAMSGTLNAAVFQTGDVPKHTVNVSLGVRMMAVGFDDKDRTYSPVTPSQITPTQSVQAPTVIGSPLAVYQVDQTSGARIDYPGGFDISKFAIAVPQLSIGSLFGTRAIVGWMSLDLGDADLGRFTYYGFGGQHSVSQYLPGLPVDVAAGIFYQQFKIGSGLVDTRAWVANVTASKRFRMLEPYVGVGYDSFDMKASYKSTTTPGDEINVDFDPVTNAHFTAGVQALLAFTRLQAEVNVAAETGVAVGLSFGRF
jgi:hypothetical protein